MMAKKISPRNRSTSLDVERDNFEKTQIASISKAIDTNECPVKEKHVRRILMGTFTEHGATTFWSIVRRLPLQENPILCWKFCHVLHKVLREGHRKSIADSYRYRGMILNFAKMWGLLKEGYGKLIQNYSNLLISKLEFHARNIRFPGNLVVTDEELDKIGENDVNVFFQLCCEIFDYLEELLALQAAVFGSLDMSRANSMTNAGQCRLAPLIPCIQDSTQLYDYIVKILFKLHASLNPSTLDGHRDRFNVQFQILKQFYINSSNLQYFKNLIQVPLLPENPPNFLLASDIDSHVTPVVIFPQQTDSPDGSEMVDTLIDLSLPQSISKESLCDEFSWSDHQNGSTSPTLIQEKNRLINNLNTKIDALHMEVQHIRIEDSRTIDDLKRTIIELECNAVEQERAFKALKMDKENCYNKIDELKQELARHKIGTNLQTEMAKEKEKFQKMKDIYNKLREEHIDLLRTKADLDKQIISVKGKLDMSDNEKKGLEERLLELSKETQERKDSSSMVTELQNRMETVENLNKKLLSEMSLLQNEKLQTDNKVSELSRNITDSIMRLKELEKSKIDDLLAKDWKYFISILSELEIIANMVLHEDDNGAVPFGVNCTPEYFFSHCNSLDELLNIIENLGPNLYENCDDYIKFLQIFLKLYHQMCYVFNSGKVIYQTLPNIEIGQDLLHRCKELFNFIIQFTINMRIKEDYRENLAAAKNTLHEIVCLKKTIVPESENNLPNDLGAMLMEELGDMEKAIQDAANKIEQMMANAKKQDTGVKLEVNEKILDACTTLMQAIKELIKNSKELQHEIISQGKGSSSAKDFYQRNHRWTEGLISAAKVVALAAKLLVDAADKVVAGKAKFEELMVASQEIAAATAQLVVASRVKADRKSQKLSKLTQSSKKVTGATGNVVATSKSCAQLVEDTDSLDFSKLSLHQAKRLEMESQVRVLELENDLNKERMRLAGLRKRHYHMAGASEGWD